MPVARMARLWKKSGVDGVSFLWRSELSGETRRPEHWLELSDSARNTVPLPGNAFVDVHQAVTVAAIADTSEMQRLIDELQAHAASGA